MPLTSRSRSASTLALAAGLLALTGCAGPDPAPPPSSSPPVFENEEQALAAVTETYQEFLDISNTILHEGGTNPERIAAVASPDVAAIEYEAYSRMRDGGYSTRGDIDLADVRLREFYTSPDSLGVVARAFACEIVGSVEILDTNGQPRPQSDRQPAIGFEISLGADSESSDHYMITAKDAEEGASSCV
jgi:hypothetical protein